MRRQRRVLAISLTFLAALVAIFVLSASRSSASRPEEAGRATSAGEPAHRPRGERVPASPAGDLSAADPRELPGYREVTAMRRAYPERIREAEVRGGEWALRMDGVWYSWADGRLLPEELQADAESYVSLRFYRYRLGPLRARSVSEETERVLRARTSRHRSGAGDTRRRFNAFLDSLYGISSEAEADRLMERVEFLGLSTRVHPLVVAPLRRVERTLYALMPHDEDVREFFASLAAIHGYNWRNIAGTARRSYHSYGMAVDLVPRSYDDGWPYWLWAAQGGIERWWDLPLSSRWQVPQAVIDAFESHGFIWGGKWLFFDNLHFEFRPESILMAEEYSPERAVNG